MDQLTESDAPASMSTMMLDVVLVTTRVTDRTANAEHAGAIRVSRHAHTDTLCSATYCTQSR